MLKISKKIFISRYCYINNHKLVTTGKSLKNTEHKGITGIFKDLKIDYPKFYKMDNLCKLAFLATELLLQDHELNNLYSDEEIGIIFQNRSSTIVSDKKFYTSISDTDNYFPSPAAFVYTLPNIMIGEICIRNKFKGENALFISEKINFSELEEYINGLFFLNKIKCCICGWVEYDGKNNYETMLFLAEKDKKDKIKIFSAKNMNSIYNNIVAM